MPGCLKLHFPLLYLAQKPFFFHEQQIPLDDVRWEVWLPLLPPRLERREGEFPEARPRSRVRGRPRDFGRSRPLSREIARLGPPRDWREPELVRLLPLRLDCERLRSLDCPRLP